MLCPRCGSNIGHVQCVGLCEGCRIEVGHPLGHQTRHNGEGFVGEGRNTVGFAGFWLRFFAYLVDSMITSLIGFGIVWMLATAMGSSVGSLFAPFGAIAENDAVGFLLMGFDGMLAAFVLMAFVAVPIGWPYFAWFESSIFAATPGKLLFALRVQTVGGERVSFQQATLRYFGSIASYLTLMIGFVMAGFTVRKQALHDMLSGCLVVKEKVIPFPRLFGQAAGAVLLFVLFPDLWELEVTGPSYSISREPAPVASTSFETIRRIDKGMSREDVIAQIGYGTQSKAPSLMASRGSVGIAETFEYAVEGGHKLTVVFKDGQLELYAGELEVTRRIGTRLADRHFQSIAVYTDDIVSDRIAIFSAKKGILHVILVKAPLSAETIKTLRKKHFGRERQADLEIQAELYLHVKGDTTQLTLDSIERYDVNLRAPNDVKWIHEKRELLPSFHSRSAEQTTEEVKVLSGDLYEGGTVSFAVAGSSPWRNNSGRMDTRWRFEANEVPVIVSK